MGQGAKPNQFQTDNGQIRNSRESLKPNRLTPQEIQALSPVVTRLIQTQIKLLVERDREYLQLGRERIKLKEAEIELKEEKRRKTLKYHEKLTFYLNFYFLLFLMLLVAVGVGMVIGVNLPEAVACRSEYTSCWHLRLRDGKIIKE